MLPHLGTSPDNGAKTDVKVSSAEVTKQKRESKAAKSHRFSLPGLEIM